MMKKGFLILFILISWRLVYPADPPRLNSNDLKDLSISREQIFTANELWGLINGGADLYLEYGFDYLLLQEITLEEQFFRIEVYVMDDPVSAFGIYSLSVHQCMESGMLVRNDCLNPFQFQLNVGRYYVSIINETGSENSIKLSGEIGRKLLESAGDQVHQGMFHRSGNELSGRVLNTRVYRGLLSIQNGIPAWESFFEGLKDFTLMVIEMKDEDGILIIAGVEFQSETELDLFVSRIEGSGIIALHQEFGKEMMLVDSSRYQGDAEKILMELREQQPSP
jgi:hypothetical protein